MVERDKNKKRRPWTQLDFNTEKSVVEQLPSLHLDTICFFLPIHLLSLFLSDLLGMFGCFWLFATICLIGFFFVIFKVPETQGKSLEDIERKMMGRIRRMSSVANIRPLSFNL